MPRLQRLRPSACLAFFGLSICALIGAGGLGTSCTQSPTDAAAVYSCSIDQSSTDSSGWIGLNSNKSGAGDVFSSLTVDRFVTLGQSFEMMSGASMTTFELRLRTFTSSSEITLGGTLTATIETDIGEGPTGIAVASASQSVTMVPTSAAAFITFTSTATFSLEAYKTYWVTLKSDSPPSSTNFVAWEASKTDAYPSGKGGAKRHTTGLWSSQNLTAGLDFSFRLNCGTPTTSSTPSPTPSATATASLFLQGGVIEHR